MFVPISMQINDETVYERRLEGIASRAENMAPALYEIGKSFKKGVAEQFASEGAYAYDWPYLGAGPWRRLTPDYHAWKQEHYPGMPILVAQGTMRRAVLNGPMLVTSKRLFYTPANELQARRYGYKRVNKDVFDRTPPQDRKVGWGYLVRSPHVRTTDMAHVAYYHQVGAGHLPSRPPVAFNLGELREWDRILLAWLNGR